jgi:hypothetical protein
LNFLQVIFFFSFRQLFSVRFLMFTVIFFLIANFYAIALNQVEVFSRESHTLQTAIWLMRMFFICAVPVIMLTNQKYGLLALDEVLDDKARRWRLFAGRYFAGIAVVAVYCLVPVLSLLLLWPYGGEMSLIESAPFIYLGLLAEFSVFACLVLTLEVCLGVSSIAGVAALTLYLGSLLQVTAGTQSGYDVGAVLSAPLGLLSGFKSIFSFLPSVEAHYFFDALPLSDPQSCLVAIAPLIIHAEITGAILFVLAGLVSCQVLRKASL